MVRTFVAGLLLVAGCGGGAGAPGEMGAAVDSGSPAEMLESACVGSPDAGSTCMEVTTGAPNACGETLKAGWVACCCTERGASSWSATPIPGGPADPCTSTAGCYMIGTDLSACGGHTAQHDPGSAGGYNCCCP